MNEVVEPRHDRDWEEYAAVSARSFGLPPEREGPFMERARLRAVARVALEDDHVVGGGLFLPAGQFFGGRSVPAGAASSFAVLPQARGKGVAGAICEALDQEMRDSGLVVSPLWPATTRLYRRWGWEVAGRAARHQVPTRSLARLRAAGTAVEDPGAEARMLQRSCAQAWNGPLDRPDWLWDWNRSHHDEQAITYGWTEDAALTGYLSYRQRPHSGWGYQIVVEELWTATPDALAGLCRLLGSHHSQVEVIDFEATALPFDHDLAWLLDDQHVTSTGGLAWMLRLVDPVAALEARGWPETIEGRMELEVEDRLLGSRQLVLEVAGGKSQVSEGGSGVVRIPSGTLAAWYAGGLSIARAISLDLVKATFEEAEFLDELTTDRPTWLPDWF